MGAKLISVIGPPASGKTTLARHLELQLPARLLREDFAGNPFLADSWRQDSARLGTELHFLLSRVGQLGGDGWPAGGVVVTDYGFCACDIFARARLARAQFALYKPLLSHLSGMVKRPDALILLEATPQELLRRISHRGRAFERAMTRPFLGRLRTAYRKAADNAGCPVIEIDTVKCDLRRASNRAALLERLRQLL